jgi:hypothetical protein
MHLGSGAKLRMKAGAAIQTDHGRDRRGKFSRNGRAARGGMIGVARDVPVRGNFIGMQAHGERALDVGRQSGHFEGRRGGPGGRQFIFGQARNDFRHIGVRGRKARHELLRGQKFVKLRIPGRVDRLQQILCLIQLSQSEGHGERNRRCA